MEYTVAAISKLFPLLTEKVEQLQMQKQFSPATTLKGKTRSSPKHVSVIAGECSSTKVDMLVSIAVMTQFRQYGTAVLAVQDDCAPFPESLHPDDASYWM